MAKLNARTKSTLEKLYKLYNDEAAQESAESASAKHKIVDLCNKHNVNFEAFMREMAAKHGNKEKEKAEAASDFDFVTQKQRNLRLAQARFKSRRNFIITCWAQGCFTKHDIAEACVFVSSGKYSNVKSNLKAVSGTRYDLNAHHDVFLKICSDGRCVVTEGEKVIRSMLK